MEPLTALSVASNVVQFIDFASKVINLTVNVYRAKPEGKLGEFYYLDKITNNFQTHNDMLKHTLRRRRGLNLSSTEKELIRICEDCGDINSKLLAALTRLKGSENELWSSFLGALKTVWSEAEIKNLRQALDGHRQQMTLHLLASLRDQVQEFQQTQAKKDAKMTVAVSDIHTMVQNFFQKVAQQHEQAYVWQQDVFEAMRVEYERERRDRNRHEGYPAEDMEERISRSDTEYFHKGLLSWLHFTELEHRQEEIDPAHERTFQWVFKTETQGKWSDLENWLQTESEPLYWITGKPAAGKSTLMKFLHAHSKTDELLIQWAQGKKLITAAYYFWNSGSKNQMSEEGMALTLLYQALDQAPELWRHLFPDKMEEYIVFGNPWRSPITWHHPASGLIEGIVRKASGVFLWVRFVTDSLLEGLGEGERLEELHAHLKELPPDLEDLIWKILSRMDDFHIKRASELLQLYRACHTKMTLLMLSYADESDPDISSKVPFGAPSIAHQHARADMMRRRLYACCKGLLEPHAMGSKPLVNTVVEYLHRTVKDYFERPDVWEKFLTLIDKEFNPHARLCNERIIRLRTSDALFFRLANPGLRLWSIASSAMIYAVLADPVGANHIQTHLLKELDIAANYLVNTHEVDRSPERYAMDFRYKLAQPVSQQPADIVPLLLSRGADPNLAIDNALRHVINMPGAFSPWEAFLHALRFLKCHSRIIPRVPSYNSPWSDGQVRDLASTWDDDETKVSDYEVFFAWGEEMSKESLPYKTAIYPNSSKENLPWKETISEKLYLRWCRYDRAKTTALAKAFLDHGADPGVVKQDDGKDIWQLAQDKLREQGRSAQNVPVYETKIQQLMAIPTSPRSSPKHKRRRSLRAFLGFGKG
ncbi:hypothetical protein N0V90_005294 [Kalmusia sp. IMI 367209]|nr:hypothetical protein N0V90_005294 [Kalmusia sp. IMI 367209]